MIWSDDVGCDVAGTRYPGSLPDDEFQLLWGEKNLLLVINFSFTPYRLKRCIFMCYLRTVRCTLFYSHKIDLAHYVPVRLMYGSSSALCIIAVKISSLFCFISFIR